MKRNQFLIAVAAVILMLASCKNGGKTGVLVPKDAALVLHLNNASLASKLSWKDVKASTWFREMHQKANDSLLQKMLDNPEASGIDATAGLTFFMKNQGRGAYGVLEGNIKDAVAFEAFTKQTSKGATVKKEGDLMMVQYSGEALAAWNAKKFAFIFDVPNFGSMNPMGNAAANQNRTKFTTDSLKKFVTAVFSLTNENSMDSDERFVSMMKEKGDMHLWMNSENLYGGMMSGMLSMMKLNVLMQGNVSASTLSFDAGKIAMNSKQYVGKELAAIFEKYPLQPVDASVINRIPSQNVVAAMAMNWPPEAMKAFLQTAGFDGMANAFLGNYNYSLDELLAAYNGQMLLSVSDFEIKKEEMKLEGMDAPYVATKPDVSVLLGLSVKDKASFDKLLSVVRSQMGDAMNQVSYKVNSDWFAIGNKPETVDKFLAGANNNVAFTSKISGHPYGMYIDIQKIMKSAQPMIGGNTPSPMLDASMQLWQDVIVTGGEWKDGYLTSNMTVNMVDQKTNSLQQMNKYFDQLAAAAKKQEQAMNQMRVDTTDVMPPIVETLPEN